PMYPSPLLPELLAMGVLFSEAVIITRSRVLTAADQGRNLVYAGSTPITLTVPTNGLPANFYASIYQQGTGAISLATAGYAVSAGGPAGSSTNGSGSTLQLQRTGPGTLMVAASHVAGVDNN